MSCPITLAGYSGICKSIGGVRTLYIADRSPLATAITFSGDTIIDLQELDSTFVQYNVKPKTSGMETTVNLSSENNTIYYQTELNLSLFKMSKENNAEFHALAIGELAVAVEDNNGVTWFMGMDYPVEMTSGSITSGTDFADKNGYEITLTDFSVKPLYKIDTDAVNLTA